MKHRYYIQIEAQETLKDWIIAGVQALLIVGGVLALALAYFDCLFY
jgi:hypothetical protein